jgi:hypothetical protein
MQEQYVTYVSQPIIRKINPELRQRYGDEVIRDGAIMSSAGISTCSSCPLRFEGCYVIRDYDRAIVFGRWKIGAKCIEYGNRITDEAILSYCKERYVLLDREFRRIHGDDSV